MDRATDGETPHPKKPKRAKENSMDEQNDNNNSDDKTSRFIGRCLIRLALYAVVGPVLGEIGATVLEIVNDVDTSS